MTYRIAKTWTFAAAHHLEGLPAEHKCARRHGHTYTVELTVAAEVLTPPGFVIDFAGLAAFRDYLTGLDHTDLNDGFTRASGLQPTCENLAFWLHGIAAARLPGGVRVEAVRVAESPQTWGEYRR